ncbi:MAG: ribosomal protein S18-alanine N-acetyltransferase [Deltaproteobacteria bacterium]|nr:ribosomal protein S18-alanine N-acetyltransferase [Deltaproteobacteria bacterium]
MTATRRHIDTALKILPMDAADIDEVVRIEAYSFARPWSRALFLKELKNPLSYSFVVKCTPEGGVEKVCAYAVIWIVADEAHILDFAVEKDERRRGLARRLLGFILGFMEERFAAVVRLEVRRSNGAAIALYESFGFEKEYERKLYYGDEDAIVMKKELEPAFSLRPDDE